MKTSVIVAASVGTVVTGFLGRLQIFFSSISDFLVGHVINWRLFGIASLANSNSAYAIYFDHKRRTDPEFRRALKRESRRQARAAREEEEAQGAKQREAIKAAFKEAQEEGFPTDVEEREAFFMGEVAKGEGLCQEGKLRVMAVLFVCLMIFSVGVDQIEAALCFYKALKVYPQPKDLIGIYDKTVPKEVLEILADMVAMDDNLALGGSFTGPASDSGHGVE
jgi:import receptor subunit TOM20